MATLSTTAWVAHDLALAAGFGGNLFAQVALHPSVKVLDSKRERGKVTREAWSRYSTVSTAALIALAGTWFAGRTFLSGREVGRASRNLTLLKDVLVGGALVGGVGSAVFGSMLGHAQADGPTIESGQDTAPEAPARVKRLQRITNVLGILETITEAAIVATTTILAMKAGKSSKWTFVSKKLLP